MASLSELMAQKAELDRQIEAVRRDERAGAIAKVRALMHEYGLTAADVEAHRVATSRRSNAGVKVAPKYRDPASELTWTGRGLKPKWLQTALASGKSLSNFAV